MMEAKNRSNQSRWSNYSTSEGCFQLVALLCHIHMFVDHMLVTAFMYISCHCQFQKHITIF